MKESPKELPRVHKFQWHEHKTAEELRDAIETKIKEIK